MAQMKFGRITKYLLLVLGAIFIAWLWIATRSQMPAGAQKGLANATNRNFPPMLQQAQNTQSASSSAIITTTTNGIPPTVSVSQLKRILDESMANASAYYVTHQTLSSGHPNDRRVAFVYAKQINGATNSASVLDEVMKNAKLALKSREESIKMRAEATRLKDSASEREAARLMVEADRQLAKADQFLTVEMSQTTDRPPLLVYQAGLPSWLIYRQIAADLAKQYIGEEPLLDSVNSSLKGIGCIYTFRNSRGQTVYVDPRGGRVFPNRNLVADSTSTSLTIDADRASRIRHQWEEFLTVGVSMDQFSTANLRH
jgi:hypothetical protein